VWANATMVPHLAMPSWQTAETLSPIMVLQPSVRIAAPAVTMPRQW